MSIPLDLTFRDLAGSDAVKGAIQSALDRLGTIYDRIQRCVVVIERPHQSQRHGQGFHVRLQIVMPDRVITIGRDPAHDDDHTNIYVAISDAFRSARRQLHDHAEIMRGEVKSHA